MPATAGAGSFRSATPGGSSRSSRLASAGWSSGDCGGGFVQIGHAGLVEQKFALGFGEIVVERLREAAREIDRDVTVSGIEIVAGDVQPPRLEGVDQIAPEVAATRVARQPRL